MYGLVSVKDVNEGSLSVLTNQTYDFTTPKYIDELYRKGAGIVFYAQAEVCDKYVFQHHPNRNWIFELLGRPFSTAYANRHLPI
jgi:hypothetical protein